MEIFLLLIVLLGIGIAAYMVYNDMTRRDTSSETTSSSTQQQTRQQRPTADLDNMSKAQLLDFARSYNMKVSPRRKKADILQFIKDNLN